LTKKAVGRKKATAGKSADLKQRRKQIKTGVETGKGAGELSVKRE